RERDVLGQPGRRVHARHGLRDALRQRAPGRQRLRLRPGWRREPADLRRPPEVDHDLVGVVYGGQSFFEKRLSWSASLGTSTRMSSTTLLQKTLCLMLFPVERG